MNHYSIYSEKKINKRLTLVESVLDGYQHSAHKLLFFNASLKKNACKVVLH